MFHLSRARRSTPRSTPRCTARFPTRITVLTVASILATVHLACAQAAGPTGLLNDTGQTRCYDGAAMVVCTSANTGDANTVVNPRQDGRFGRDPAAPVKVGGGAAGFDFTRVCMNGTLNCAGAADTGVSPVTATAWACTQDNVTQLIWSLYSGEGNQTTYARTTLPATHNSGAGRCGGTGWRLPTVRELLSIVDFSGVNPSIDIANFPGTQANGYWSSDAYAPNAAFAWDVGFDDGSSFVGNASFFNWVRLVRNAP
jgi:Protein of unknown function (DUF1566)